MVIFISQYTAKHVIHKFSLINKLDSSRVSRKVLINEKLNKANFSSLINFKSSTKHLRSNFELELIYD